MEAASFFSYDPASATYTKLKDFHYANGIPYGSLMQASDGKLYGMTKGDIYHFGVAFSYDIPTSTYTKLSDFNGDNGTYPWFPFSSTTVTR